MNRFEIKEMRDLVELNGFFVEEIQDDHMVVSHLQDNTDKLYRVFSYERCPDCGAYLLFDDETKEYICLNPECFYNNCISTPPELEENEESTNNKQTMQMTFTFDELDKVYANAFMEDIERLIEEWYEDLITIKFDENPVDNESTLGIVNDDE